MRPKIGGHCFCNLVAFKIRNYAQQILRSLNPFFEIVVAADMQPSWLKKIVSHLEDLLNWPLKNKNKQTIKSFRS